MYEDVANNRYRMFSSEEAYAFWKENPSDNSDLELVTESNPVDACYEMIIKLHEQKLL